MTNDFTQQISHLLLQHGRIEPLKFDTPFLLLSVKEFPFLFHLITLPHTQNNPLFFQNMSLRFFQKGYQVIHLWEDRWNRQQTLVQQTINHKLGNCRRVFARQTLLKQINAEIATAFLNNNHMLSGVKSRYHFGLYAEDQLLSVASFSNKRTLTYTLPHKNSYEWVRYATLPNLTIVGGLSKVLNGFIKSKHPDHIMTYCDMDFGMASGFHKVGFKTVKIMPPLCFSIDKNFERHYKTNTKHYYNAGNLKLERLITL